MNKERETIRFLNDVLCGENDSMVFNTDAQYFSLHGRNYLFTTDEFSAEDLFSDNDPFQLAWNLAVATISDILAAGGIPLFYGHSMTIPSSWDMDFLKEFARGLKECISGSGSKFLGGDTGFSDSWKYTGIAIGQQDRALDRSGAMAGESIYMTGSVGTGNLIAALSLFDQHRISGMTKNNPGNSFAFRGKEAKLIRQYASSCIDSSDGMLRSLINLSESSNVGFAIDFIPYCNDCTDICKILGINKLIMFIGEGGEYELVFTIPPALEKEFNAKCKEEKITATRIGHITDNKKYMVGPIEFSGYNVHARDYDDVRDYIAAVTKFIN